jgi:hypothetical protein
LHPHGEQQQGAGSSTVESNEPVDDRVSGTFQLVFPGVAGKGLYDQAMQIDTGPTVNQTEATGSTESNYLLWSVKRAIYRVLGEQTKQESDGRTTLTFDAPVHITFRYVRHDSVHIDQFGYAAAIDMGTPRFTAPFNPMEAANMFADAVAIEVTVGYRQILSGGQYGGTVRNENQTKIDITPAMVDVINREALFGSFKPTWEGHIKNINPNFVGAGFNENYFNKFMDCHLSSDENPSVKVVYADTRGLAVGKGAPCAGYMGLAEYAENYATNTVVQWTTCSNSEEDADPRIVRFRNTCGSGLICMEEQPQRTRWTCQPGEGGEIDPERTGGTDSVRSISTIVVLKPGNLSAVSHDEIVKEIKISVDEECKLLKEDGLLGTSTSCATIRDAAPARGHISGWKSVGDGSAEPYDPDPSAMPEMWTVLVELRDDGIENHADPTFQLEDIYILGAAVDRRLRRMHTNYNKRTGTLVFPGIAGRCLL